MEIAKLVLQFVEILIWPLFGAFVVLALRKQVAALLKGSSLSSLKLPGGIELSLAQLASATAAGVAIGRQNVGGAEVAEGDAVQMVTDAVLKSNRAGKTFTRRRILWVDDNPRNNESLVDAFRSLDYEVVLARSTDEALAHFKQSKFDLVISDMGRPPDGQAGLTLTNEMRERGIHLPVIIFAANWARAHAGKEAELGIAKITNDASTVYATVVDFMSGGELRVI